VEDCDKLGGLVKRELIPRSLNQHGVNPIASCGKRRELKHLITSRKRKQKRLRQ
jgi:hypothetical protein